jgi:competence protein ComEA
MQHTSNGDDIMTQLYFLDSYTRLATAVGRIFAIRRLPAAVALAMTLALLGGVFPGSGGQVYAQDEAPPATMAAVNINKADAATIASALKGVGNARAEEIVRYREAYGPFTSVDELTEVKGIGNSTLDNNRAKITLE